MNTIILTGFKPFGCHAINNSETIVRLIEKTGLDKELNVKLVTDIFNVSYMHTLDKVQQLWAVHNPFLVVHLGVHNRDTIHIEKCARKYLYRYPDNFGVCPAYEVCTFGDKDRIYTELDTTNIVANSPRGDYIIKHSENAGLYLCEFAFYISLSHDPKKVVFIHVPPHKDTRSPAEVAYIIRDLIKELYKQRLEMSKSLP